MRRFFAGLIVAALVVVMLPSIAVASATTSVTGMDTIAGLGTFVKGSGLQSGETVYFAVKHESSEYQLFETKASRDGKATIELADTYTRRAGTYTVSILNSEKRILGAVGSFVVYPDDPDMRMSRMYAQKKTFLADGVSAAEITVLVVDSFGNPIQNRSIAVVSNRPEDTVSALRAGMTDANGNATYVVRSTKTGAITLTALDSASNEVFQNKLSLTAVKRATLGLGGDDTFMASSFLALNTTAQESTTESFEIDGLDEPVTTNTTTSFEVIAKTAAGGIDTSYTGTVTFSSTDTNAVLPDDYTFQPDDLGQHSFDLGLTFKTVGTQELSVADVADETVEGSTTVSVEQLHGSAVDAEDVVITKPTEGSYGTSVMDVQGRATPNSEVEIYDNGRKLSTVTANASGIFSYTTGRLSDGEHVFFAKSQGFISSEVVITLDTRATAIHDVEITPNPAAPGGDVEISVTVDSDVQNMSLIVADTVVQLYRDDDSGETKFRTSITAPASSGSYPIDIILTDAQGNDGSFSEAATLVVDESLRDITSGVTFHVPSRVTGVQARAGNGTVTLTWDPAIDDTGVAFYKIYYGIDRSDLSLVAYTADPSTEWYVPSLQNGVEYFFQIVGVDDEGNEGDQRSGTVGSVPNGQGGSLSFADSTRSQPATSLPQDGPGLLGLLIPLGATGLFGALRRKR
ncbi:MAG: Ig-like domain-containing protein [Patescibacteria group bacterium]